MDNSWIIHGKPMENSWIIHAKEIIFIHNYFHEADNLPSAEFMQTESVWSFLPRYRFKHTISFSGTSLFYHNIFFWICFCLQNIYVSGTVFVKQISYRNYFCGTNPSQEWFLQTLSFSGTVFSDIVLLRNCLLRHCPSQKLSSQTLSFSGTVFSDIVMKNSSSYTLR